MINLESIGTEQKNERTAHIDKLSTIGIIKLMNDEDKNVALAVEKELPHIANAVDIIYEAFRKNGRLIYCGCGTSGRLGVLDASECPPTFGTNPDMVVALLAGGPDAFIRAIEGAEDDYDLGAQDLKNIAFCEKDVLVGIAASGRTPYVLGAISYAKSVGAKVVSLTCCPGSSIDTAADISIAPTPGPEVVTGSTRLKSGTAQKMVLNMLTTASMIKLGKVYGNLMVDVKATNQKLVERTVSIVCSATGTDNATARKTLKACSFSAKHAIATLLTGKTPQEAEILLEHAQGHISKALDMAQIK